MGDEAPPPAPAPMIIAPPAPIQQSASEAADAQVQAFGKLIPLLPQYAQTLTDIQRTQAPQMSEINLEQQQKYAPQLIQSALDNLKLADPTGLAVRQGLGKRVLGGLSDEQFGVLSPSEQRQAEQDIRAGQVARGGGTGMSDTFQEALAKYGAGIGRQQMQLSNAGSFLNGSTPQASFGSLNQAGQTAPVGTQNVSGFSSGLFPSTNALIGQQQSNYGQYTNALGQANSLASSNYQFQNNPANATANPFMTGLSTAAGIAGSILPFAMCWVAEELWGKEDSKTLTVRSFMEDKLDDEGFLGDFARMYQKKGLEWAEDIKDNKDLRSKALAFWNSLFELASQEKIYGGN